MEKRTEIVEGFEFTFIREDAPVEFECTRCKRLAPKKALKKARNRIEWRDSHTGQSGLICNGCFGNALSRLRAGEDSTLLEN